MKKGENKGFSLIELIVVVAIMAVLVGIIAPTMLHYIESAREKKDCAAMGELLNQLYLSAADDINVYVTVPDEGQPFTSAADSDTMIICPETGGTLYQQSVAGFLGTKTLTFESDAWRDAALQATVFLTWDGIRVEYNDALKELMGAENLRYQ